MHWLDPEYLPQTAGTVDQFLINPHGEIDGMIFKSGMEVHFPPHHSRKIEKAVALGDKVTVRGVKPRDADMIAGITLETTKGGSIVDDGPPHGHKHGKHGPKHEHGGENMEASGIVRRAPHGPKGEIRGVLLESGEAIRFPKHEAEKLKTLTKPGAKFAVRGHAVTTKFGAVINAQKAGSSQKTLRAIDD